MVTKLKRLLKPDKTLPLHKLLNAWDIVDDTLIGVDGSLTSCYELVFLPDAVHMPDSEENSFLEGFKRALTALPDDYVLQFVVTGRSGNYDKVREYAGSVRSETGLSKEIVSKKISQFEKMESRRMLYRLYITAPPRACAGIAKDRFYFNKILNPAGDLKALHESRRMKHSDSCENFMGALGSSGIKARRMSADEVTKEFYERLNPEYSKSVPFNNTLKGETLRSQFCRSATEHTFYDLTINGHYYRGVNLYQRPEYINFYNIAKFFANLKPPFDAVFTLQYTPDSLQSDSVVRKDLKFEATLAGSTMTAEGRQKSDAIHQMLADTLESGQRIFDFSLCVIVEENNKEFLGKKTGAALGAFREIGDASGIVDDMNHLYLFLSSLPGHWFFNRRTHKFAIDAISHFLPVHRPWQGCKTPKMIFPTAGGEIIGLDAFDPDLPAKHGLLIGSTGSGKSFTTNYILTNFMAEAPQNHVVIIDVGGSYRKLCELFDGQYIDVRYDDSCAFNPFPAKKYFFDMAGKPDADSLDFMSRIIQRMLKKETLSGRETMIIENTLIGTYRNSGSDSPPTLGDFASRLKDFNGDEEDRATAVSFFKDLGPWVEGRYSILLNNPNPRLVLDPKKQLIVFDLQKIKDEPELGPVMFFVVRSAIQSRLADLSLNKIIVIDEGWQFFSDKVGAQLIENLYRTARKFGGAVFSISQSPEDFLKTPASTSIISNSYTKFILKLSAQHELLEKLGLKASEIDEIKDLEMSPGKYSEVFYRFLNHSIVLRIKPNKLDYWICTTNDKDKNKEDAMRKKHPELPLWDIILKLSEEEI